MRLAHTAFQIGRQARVVIAEQPRRASQQHGSFTFDEVVARRLAGGQRIAEHSEQVIPQLEREPDGCAEFPQRGNDFRTAARQFGAELDGSGDGVRRRLEAIDAGGNALLFGGIRVAVRSSPQVQHLTAEHFRAHGAPGGRHPRPGAQCRRRLGEQIVRPGQREIADQDGHGNSVVVGVTVPAGVGVRPCDGPMGARPSAAGIGTVQDVVVHQCTRLDQLESRGRPDHVRGNVGNTCRADSSAATGNQIPGQQELRTDALAALPDEISEALRLLREFRRDLGEVRAAKGEFVGQRRFEPLQQAVERGSRRRMGHRLSVPGPCGEVGTSLAVKLSYMATVRDRLAAPGPHFSVEFYPPRTDLEEAGLWLAIRRLEPLGPAFVSVTYGAGGSHRDRTIRITERIATETTLLPVAHLAAVGHSVSELRHVIGSYAAVGVRNILAVRGDPPGDPTAEWVAHPEGLTYASDLVRLVRALGDFEVGVAAFPELHPRSPSVESDVHYLAEKFRAGADYAISQMLFSAADWVRLRDRAVKAGIDAPILPGIMPVTSYERMMRICELSGQKVPVELAARLEAVRGDVPAGRAIGMEHAVAMARELVAEGAPGLHFNTFNRSKATLDVLDALGWAGTPSGQAAQQRADSATLAPATAAASG